MLKITIYRMNNGHLDQLQVAVSYLSGFLRTIRKGFPQQTGQYLLIIQAARLIWLPVVIACKQELL